MADLIALIPAPGPRVGDWQMRRVELGRPFVIGDLLLTPMQDCTDGVLSAPQIDLQIGSQSARAELVPMNYCGALLVPRAIEQDACGKALAIYLDIQAAQDADQEQTA